MHIWPFVVSLPLFPCVVRFAIRFSLAELTSSTFFCLHKVDFESDSGTVLLTFENFGHHSLEYDMISIIDVIPGVNHGTRSYVCLLACGTQGDASSVHPCSPVTCFHRAHVLARISLALATANIGYVVSFSAVMAVLLFAILLGGVISQRMNTNKTEHH
jgi:hypothetical protein